MIKGVRLLFISTLDVLDNGHASGFAGPSRLSNNLIYSGAEIHPKAPFLQKPAERE
jgi:hypothetical protein